MEATISYINLDTARGIGSDDNDIQKVINYLEHVVIGNEGTPYCPFVNRVHQNNGYYLNISTQQPDKIDFNQIIKEMQSAFFKISPATTNKNQQLDITTIVTAFSHPDAISHVFGKKLEEARNHFRNNTLRKGLMLSQMYPFHSDPNGGNKYVSAIPLLMVRRMHLQDFIFMKTAEARQIFMTFFDQSDAWKT